MSGVKSESEEEERLIGSSAFEIGFYFIFKASVEFFFFGVEELEVSAVLSVLETVIWFNLGSKW